MADEAIKVLQQAIDDARREGFAEGYAAAMQKVRDLVASSPLLPEAGSKAMPKAREQRQRLSPTSRVRLSDVPYSPRISGDVADRLIEDAYRLIAPRSAGPTEAQHIVKQNTGTDLPETSVRRAIDRLVAQKKLQRTGTRTWRYGSDEMVGGAEGDENPTTSGGRGNQDSGGNGAAPVHP